MLFFCAKSIRRLPCSAQSAFPSGCPLIHAFPVFWRRRRQTGVPAGGVPHMSAARVLSRAAVRSGGATAPSAGDAPEIRYARPSCPLDLAFAIDDGGSRPLPDRRAAAPPALDAIKNQRDVGWVCRDVRLRGEGRSVLKEPPHAMLDALGSSLESEIVRSVLCRSCGSETRLSSGRCAYDCRIARRIDQREEKHAPSRSF